MNERGASIVTGSAVSAYIKASQGAPIGSRLLGLAGTIAVTNTIAKGYNDVY